MRPVDGELLRLLGDMPFLDRLEAAAVSGWSSGAVYKAVPRLEDAGLIASVPHGTELVSPTRRFHLTAAGLRRLAREQGMALEVLLPSRPRLGPVAARAPGTARRPGRRLPPRLHHIQHRLPSALPLVSRHADGRRPDSARRQDRRHRPAGTHVRQDGLQQAALATPAGDAPRSRPPADARRGAAAPRPQDARPDLPCGALCAGERGGGSGPGRPCVAAALRQRRRRPAGGRRPPAPRRRSPRRAAPGTGLPSPGHRRAHSGGRRARLPAARPAEARRKARPQFAVRLALARPERPGRAAGSLPSAGVPAHRRPGGLRTGGPRSRLGPPPGPHRPGAGDAGPQGPRRRGRG